MSHDRGGGDDSVLMTNESTSVILDATSDYDMMTCDGRSEED